MLVVLTPHALTVGSLREWLKWGVQANVYEVFNPVITDAYTFRGLYWSCVEPNAIALAHGN